MAQKTKKFTPTYALVQCFYWFCYGTALSYASPYLLACGLSNTAIGLISAAACALSVAVQPLLAAYADREGSLSVKTLVLIMGAGILALGIGLIFAYGKNAALNGLLLGSAILLVEISLPFVNALATETINAGQTLNYSFARGAYVGYRRAANRKTGRRCTSLRFGNIHDTVSWSNPVFPLLQAK